MRVSFVCGTLKYHENDEIDRYPDPVFARNTRRGLDDSTLQSGTRSGRLWWREHAFAIRLAWCFVLVTLATVFHRYFERNAPDTNLIWIANGLLLTYLLLAPRWRWPAYLIAGIAAMALGSAIIGEPWRLNLLYNLLNLTEVLIAALLLRRKSTQLPHFTDGRYLARFIGFAIFAGPMAAASILALTRAVLNHANPLKTFLNWLLADGLGAAIVVPTFVAIFQPDILSTPGETYVRRPSRSASRITSRELSVTSAWSEAISWSRCSVALRSSRSTETM